MSNVNAPYFVSFTADHMPATVDHSKVDPGPADGKKRAGYTKFLLDARVTLKWEDGPLGSDGKTPFFFESVNIQFFLKDFHIEITSDYKVGSCPYRATLEHEQESHVRRPIRIFSASRDLIVAKLNQISLPTKQSPGRIAPGQGKAEEATQMAPVVAAVKDVKKQIFDALKKDRLEQDAPAAYQSVYTRCRPSEWGTRDP
jgi:hypothetical protein